MIRLDRAPWNAWPAAAVSRAPARVPSRRIRWIGALLALVLCPAFVHALTSAAARFEPARVAIGQRQPATLLIAYFPGDGEAVTRAQVQMTGSATLLEAVSSAGSAQAGAQRIDLDYTAAPIGLATVDTVHVTLQTGAAESLGWEIALSTTVDTEVQQRYRQYLQLPVVAPLRARWSVQPQTWYPGEDLRLEIRLDNEDQRPIDALHLHWPDGIRVEEGEAATAGSIVPGASQSWEVQLFTPVSLPPTISIPATVDGAGIVGSPLAAVKVHVAPVPKLRVHTGGRLLQRGQAGDVRCVLANESTEEIRFRQLILTVDGVAAIEVVGAPSSQTVARLSPDAGNARVEVGPGRLAPGDTLVVPLRVVPRRSGPLGWRASFLPVDRVQQVSLPGVAVTNVVDGPGAPAAGSLSTATDLELVRSSLRAIWQQVLTQLPVPAGAAYELRASGRHKANWIVEEALTEGLLARGDRLPLEPDSTAYRLEYRVATAQATYEPKGAMWNPLDSKQARDTRVVVFARIVDAGGTILWSRRVEASAADVVASGASVRLGGAEAVPQRLIPADQRALEVGLSGLIMGGLFFVFFSP